MSQLPAETLNIEGPDALAFAQAQLGSDVRELAVGAWQWSAWLNAQGRVRALGHLMRLSEDRLQLLLRGASANAIAASLAAYVLRKRLTVTANAPATLLDAPACATGVLQIERDGITLGLGTYAMRIVPAPDAAPQAWRLAAIHAGHPWLPDGTIDALLAPSLALDRLGATSLDKGCFPGQEIVARMHYRGTGKQHLRRLETDSPVVAGATVRVDGQRVGTLLDVAADGDHFSALTIFRDTLAHGQVLVSVDGVPCNIRTFNVLA